MCYVFFFFFLLFFFFQAEDGIRDGHVTGVQTCALPIYQGIPMGGYNKLIDGLLEGADTKVSVDFFKDEIELPNGNKGVLKDH